MNDSPIARLGSIVTRSDNKKFFIASDILPVPQNIPNDIFKLSAKTDAAKYLIGKRINDYYYENGIGDYTIIDIDNSFVKEYKRIREQQKQLLEERKRRKQEEEEKRRVQEEQRLLEERKRRKQEEEKRRIQEEQRLLEERRKQERAKAVLNVLETELIKYNFIQADELFKAQNLISEDQYKEKKVFYVQKWFKEHVKEITESKTEVFTLDDEQATAVIDNHKNTIVAARAGSGKTRTIVAKVVFLIKKYEYKQDELLAFVFNNDAMQVINRRLDNILVDNKPLINNSEIAFTFHAFARRIVYSICSENEKYGKILVDKKDCNYRSLFIQEIVKKMPKKQIYSFFRDEMFQINKQIFENEKDYYDYLRSTTYGTLDGKVVKSRAEKIISDYLFEHGIKYYYENEYYLNSAYPICKKECRKKLYELKNIFGEESIKPDFFLVDYNTPWEHWAINGNEDVYAISKINAKGVIGDYHTYKSKAAWKRWFYKKDWIDSRDAIIGKYQKQIIDLKPLIETTINMNESREDFEKKIEAILKARGCYKPKQSEQELIDKVWKTQVKRFSKMITRFIDRAELLFPNELATLEKAVANANTDERTKAFLNISLSCYKDYLGYLSDRLPKQNLITRILKWNEEETIDYSQYGIDFSLLLMRATELINSDNDKESNLNKLLNNKKMLLIDEYQDFSKLFFESIAAVRKKCPQSKLFVVGDDWQAINGFAGSDTEYFKRFELYFPEDNNRLKISTNYRSAINIVNYARSFIQNSLNEFDDFTPHSRDAGNVKIVDPTQTKIEKNGDEDDIYKTAMAVSDGKNPSKYSTQYIKTVTEIVKAHRDESIMLLHRNNDTSMYMIDIENFKKRLKKVVIELGIMTNQEFDDRVSIMTMHRSKGLEKDVVIILEADESIIPSYHQDTMLYSIFGDTEKKVSIEQKHLFYVAMTRAKNSLYILHKSQPGHDGFIEYLK